MQDQEVIREFLVESHENLSRLDQELVQLEKSPKDAAMLASIFRTIHTIKGTCGFLAFSKLERITHQAETLLSHLRDGQRELSPSLISLVLDTIDAIRKVLASIEASGEEGPEGFETLTERLRAAAQMTPDSATDRRKDHPKEDSAESSEPRKPEEGAAIHSAAADLNIRVGVGLLDKLMDLVGELVLTRNQILQFNAEREDPALNATSQRLNLITTELQEGVMKTRMQPIGMVWNKLPRVVRDMSVALGKQIRLEMDGAATELDRTIIEAIKDPLVHLVRNSCDHGLETPEVRTRAGKQVEGRLTLRAYHEGGQVNIEIGDDGAGIDIARIKQKSVEKGFLRPEQAEKLNDREALNLIFHAGLSTATKVTNVSGRGVGMDVVKANIEKIGGVVDVFSRLGQGTTVKIRIPLTLAIIPGLVISSGGERFVIPQVSLLELIRLEGEAGQKRIERVQGAPVYRRRGSLLPIAYLNSVLGLKQTQAAEAVSIVVLQAEDRQFGLVVDGINDTQEIVVKPLGKQLKGLTAYAGATIMGDGRVALILDVAGIGRRSGVLAEFQDQARVSAATQTQASVEQQRLLLFRAGSFERLAIPLSLVSRLEEFPQSGVEHAAGGQVVQYRNRILPLVSLKDLLEPGSQSLEEAPDPLQVVVFSDGEFSVGMIVDQILDVAEEAVTVRQKSNRKGLLGSGVVGKHVTDFIDLNEVIGATKSWAQRAGGISGHRKILVAEGSAFSRGIIRASLDMEGYSVEEAASFSEAIRLLEQQPADAVVSAMDLPPSGSSALLDAMRLRPEWNEIPVLTLAESAEQVTSNAPTGGYEDCQVKFDHEAMLLSLARFASPRDPSPEESATAQNVPVGAEG